MSVNARVQAIAGTWIGTPYRHQGAMKGVGCDCLGLVRGIWRELYGQEPEAVPAYAPDWAERSGEERLMAAAERHSERAYRAIWCCFGSGRIWQPNMQGSWRVCLARMLAVGVTTRTNAGAMTRVGRPRMPSSMPMSNRR